LPEGYSICLVFLKLFERIYAPLAAGLLQPFSQDNKLQQQRLSTNASCRLSTISSMPLASKPPEHRHNENKIPVTTHITV
jgi:hypothetical protein